MNAAQRREKILQQLHGASAPISASALAAKLGVSRQIVVGDVALLRAGGAEIEATPRGYQFHPTPGGYTGILACVHRTASLIHHRVKLGAHLIGGPVHTGQDAGVAAGGRVAWWSMWRWKTRFTANCGAT